MAFITLSGTLLDPNGDLAVGDQIRFTHKSTTGETVESAVSLITINPAGTYSLPLQYGLVLVEYKDVRAQQFKNLGVATVNGTNPATSIPELLNALVPVSSAELIEFQAILADCVTAQVAAEAAQVAAEYAALVGTVPFDSVADYKNYGTALTVGRIVYLKDRNANFTVIAGTGTDNTFNIIASTSVSQSIELLVGEVANAKEFGLMDDWNGSTGTDNYLGAKHMLENFKRAKFEGDVFMIDTANAVASTNMIELLGGARITGNAELFLKPSTPRKVDSGLLGITDVRDIDISGIKFNQDTEFDVTLVGNDFGIDQYIRMNTTGNNVVNTIRIHNNTFIKPLTSAIHSALTVGKFTYKNISVTENIFDSTGSHGAGFNYAIDSSFNDNYGFNIGNIIFADVNATPGLIVDFSGGCDHCMADGNEVNNCRTGIKTQNDETGVGIPTNCIITNNIIRNIKDLTNGYGIQILGSNHVVSGNVIDTENATTSVDCILIQADQTKNITITGNTLISANGNGIEMKSSNNASVRKNISIDGNTIIGDIGVNILALNDYCVVANNSITASLRAISSSSRFTTVSGNICRLSEGTDNCMHFGTLDAGLTDKAYHATVTGNKFENDSMNTGNGIYFQFSADDTIITGNNVTSNKHGILFDLGAVGSVISNNLITVTNELADTSQTCVVAGSSDVMDDITITGNQLRNLSTFANSDCIRAPLDSSVVNSNRFNAVGGDGVTLTGAKDYQVVTSNIFEVGNTAIAGIGAGGVNANNIVKP